MSITLQDREFQSCIARIETLVRELERVEDPAAKSPIRKVLEAVMDLHSMGLERMLELIAQAEGGGAILENLLKDEVVGGLLLLHDLHPMDLEQRVRLALDKVRPYLQSHGGNVELLGIHANVVALRMQGHCHGCPSSAMTLKLAIEEAIYAKAPDVAGIEVDGVVPEAAHGEAGAGDGSAPGHAPAQFVPLEHVTHDGAPVRGRPAGTWETLPHAERLKEGAMELRHIGGGAVLLCRSQGRLYAYEATCPACHRKIEGHLDAGILTCGGCGGRFDVRRAGRGVDDATLHMEPYPLLEEAGQVRMALPAMQERQAT